MKFRPCIDIHAGVVKQIVGSTLLDVPAASSSGGGGGSSSGTVIDEPEENFVSTKSAGFYSKRYQEDKLTGGHIIMLGPGCEEAAKEALQEYPGGMQIGGGIDCCCGRVNFHLISMRFDLKLGLAN
jgi:phosphoribosylformimino-5-aminoimidazole carboxamide ribotide isomerase